MKEMDKKFKTVVILKMIAVVVVFFVVLFCVTWSKQHVESELEQTKIFDMKWYIVYFVSVILVRTMYIAAIVLALLYLAFVVLSYIAAIKKDGELPLFILTGSVLKYITKGAGVLVFGVVMILGTLFWPIEEVREYRMEGRKVLAFKALEYQIKDINRDPVRAVIENYELKKYMYEHIGRRGTSSNSVLYIKYMRDGKEYITPCTMYMYSRLRQADLAEGGELEVFLLPNTGIVVDFAETPLVLKKEESQLKALLEEYGYPYSIELNGEWEIIVFSSGKYSAGIFDTYRRILNYEVFWISYLEEDFDEIAISRDENPYQEMNKDGTYAVQVGKKDGTRLSEKVIFVIKDGDIVKINDSYIHIDLE